MHIITRGRQRTNLFVSVLALLVLVTWKWKAFTFPISEMPRQYVTPDSPDWPDDDTWKRELGDLLSPTAELYNNMHVNYRKECRRKEKGFGFIELHGGVCMIDNQCHYQFCNRDGKAVSAVPPYSVKVVVPEDISVAIAFANKYDIQVSVKLTGHNFAGSSYTKDSLNIWMPHLKPLSGMKRTNFTDSCGSSFGPSLRLSGGALNNDVFDTVRGDYNLLTGDVRSVGFAGWLMGVGLGQTSRYFGLGVDNALQFGVVLANGEYVIADACSNSELFWALRGGGGGFGVVTHMEYKLHPATNVTSVRFVLHDPKRSDVEAFMRYWARVTPDIDKRLAGAFFGVDNFDLKIIGDEELAERIFLSDFVKFLDANTTGSYTVDVAVADNWYEMMGGDDGYDKYRHRLRISDKGHGAAASARLVPEWMVKEDPESVIDFLVDIGMQYDLGGYWLGGAIKEKDAHYTSTHPILRETLWAMTTTNREASQRFREFFNNSVSGCQFNHHSPEEPEWRTALWGDEHYARLLEIKQKYDPEYRFNCWHCVGYQGPQFSVLDLAKNESSMGSTSTEYNTGYATFEAINELDDIQKSTWMIQSVTHLQVSTLIALVVSYYSRKIYLSRMKRQRQHQL